MHHAIHRHLQYQVQLALNYHPFNPEYLIRNLKNKLFYLYKEIDHHDRAAIEKALGYFACCETFIINKTN
jgi:hypothetical protein